MESSKMMRKAYAYSFTSPALTQSELAVFDEQLYDLGCQNIVRKTESGRSFSTNGGKSQTPRKQARILGSIPYESSEQYKGGIVGKNNDDVVLSSGRAGT